MLSVDDVWARAEFCIREQPGGGWSRPDGIDPINVAEFYIQLHSSVLDGLSDREVMDLVKQYLQLGEEALAAKRLSVLGVNYSNKADAFGAHINFEVVADDELEQMIRSFSEGRIGADKVFQISGTE